MLQNMPAMMRRARARWDWIRIPCRVAAHISARYNGKTETGAPFARGLAITGEVKWKNQRPTSKSVFTGGKGASLMFFFVLNVEVWMFQNFPNTAPNDRAMIAPAAKSENNGCHGNTSPT